MTLTLSTDDYEYELILLVLGYATGSATLRSDPAGLRMCLNAANAFGKAGGRGFQPYDVDAEVAAFEKKWSATDVARA